MVALAWGCQGVTASANAPVAIEFVTPAAPPVALEEFDTVVIGVRVRDQSGDTIPGAPIQLVSLYPDTVGIDTALHYGLVGLRAGQGRVIAISGSLQSDPLAVSVSVAADSLAPVGAVVDTVAPAPDSVSASLAVQLLDFHSTPGDTVDLQNRLVTFAITSPAFDSLGAATVTLGNDSLTAVVLTGPGPPTGAAAVIVRRNGSAPQPDSVVVEASATRASGAVVHGSPVRFVVYFQ